MRKRLARIIYKDYYCLGYVGVFVHNRETRTLEIVYFD